MKYELLIKQEKKNTKNITFSHLMAAFLLIIMGAVTYMAVNAIKFAANVTVENKSTYEIIAGSYLIIGILLLFISIKFNKKIIKNKTNSNTLRTIEILLILPILIFSYINKWYLPASYAAIGILGIVYAFYAENNIRKQYSISIENEGVLVKRENIKIISWENIIKLIVRHNILTIEASENKLYQYDLLLNQNINTEEIEAFSLKKIKEEKKIIKNNW
ncbi:MAG TPA: hypothetical protein PKX92_12235 [Edaphocola sp.]|nr:hypothetical protein [Edaphocola sp.]